MKYKDYIHSEEWRELRQSALDHFGGKCKCGSKIRMQVHHKNYNESGLNPLQPLCEDCHEALHYLKKISYGTGTKRQKTKARYLVVSKPILSKPSIPIGPISKVKAQNLVRSFLGKFATLPAIGRGVVLQRGIYLFNDGNFRISKI